MAVIENPPQRLCGSPIGQRDPQIQYFAFVFWFFFFIDSSLKFLFWFHLLKFPWILSAIVFFPVIDCNMLSVFISCYQVNGTTERPRLCVFLSNKHMYVQVIDDTMMHTLASASTVQKPISEEVDYSPGPTIVSSFGTGHISIRSFVVVGLTLVFIDEV